MPARSARATPKPAPPATAATPATPSATARRGSDGARRPALGAGVAAPSTASRSCAPYLRVGDLAGDLGQRLLHGLHGRGERLLVRVGQLVSRARSPTGSSSVRYLSTSLSRAVNCARDRARQRGVDLLPAPAAGCANACSAPSSLAWKSSRSMCEYRSSSPVILLLATSSSSSCAPLASSDGL